MKRADITGKTFYFKNYSLEFVRVKGTLKVVALWKNDNLIKRFEVLN